MLLFRHSSSCTNLALLCFAALAADLHVVAQGYAPLEAPKHMALEAGLQAQLVASEPMIAQPVCIEFDDRGRLWVIQYLQYPNPAGLKRASVDRWSRTKYERIPEPPPLGPKGADRITILDDTDGDGRADSSHDFLSGLNLATGLAFGHGGVFVLNVPYLLFFPDRNGDDIPDGDPVVCLEGFGMDDAHSVANSLTWGPDGWLYGCQGSTVTANIRGIEFQQGVWRYHPRTHEFELFCEGGGNSWGLDFDDEGELVYSTNLGPYRNLHGVQGGYFWKSFGKHGALHNPYAFGFLNHIPHTNFTGGHVTDGGIIYQGTNLPPRFRNQYICGDLLGHGVQWHPMYRWGSTFTSSHGGYLLTANDTWFASTDVCMSPDGAIYVADWCDQRTAHPDPDADWDRSNGRVYRIAASSTKPIVVPDLRRFSTPQLISLLGAPNDWFVRQARRLLADRRDPTAIRPLRSLLFETKNDSLALQALWALYVSGGFDEAIAKKSLVHPYSPIRKWTVRFLGDEKRISADLAGRLATLARTDPDVRVRGQLAASAKRLPPRHALPIIEALLLRDADATDPCVPLQLWWALEHHAASSAGEIEHFASSNPAWKSALFRDTIVERLMRRWIAEGTPATFDAAAHLLGSAPDARQGERLLAAVAQGFHDRPVGDVTVGPGTLFASVAAVGAHTSAAKAVKEPVTPAFARQFDSGWRADTSDPVLLHVGLHLGRPAAMERARTLLSDSNTKPERRAQLAHLLGEFAEPSDAQRMLKLVGDAPDAVQLAALEVLAGLDRPQLAASLLERYPTLSDRVRTRVRQVLLSRKGWAEKILGEVDAGRLATADFTQEEVRAVALHHDEHLDGLVRKHWGRVSSGSPEEKLAEMRRLNNDLNAGPGDAARGRQTFSRSCGACHTMYGEGGKVGPDLTQANRKDREFLLASIVDPNAVIRKEFIAYDVQMKDDRVLSGVIVEQSGDKLTLGLNTGEHLTISQSQVASLRESTVSLMPEDLAKTLKPQELRDLFGFLQSTKPPKP